MRQYLVTLLSILLLSNLSLAQFVNIPDATFRTWLNNNGYASCMSGTMMDTTCTAVVNATKVTLGPGTIADLTGIQYFDNLDTLNCEANAITNIPALPPALLYLSCYSNHLTSLPAVPSSLLELTCHDNYLTSLPPLPSSLQVLTCHDNQLTYLPTLPSSLNSITCGYNQITSLPVLPPNLVILDCKSNLITSLPSLPGSLYSLLCNDNQLSSFPALPNSIANFDCSNNLFTSLPPYPSSLLFFSCKNNFLTSLPSIYPSSLSLLDCSGNQLTSLPAGLPLNLHNLICNGNQLTSLPVLNQNLYALVCSNNPLTIYPMLPAGLGNFYCDSVLLPALPVLPASIKNLSCKYCPVNSLPDLPDTVNFLDISYTPITCLPHILRISTLFWTGTNLSCLPNVIQITGSTPSASVLGLCQPSGNCPTYWNIKGNVYNDVNSDCINNAEDSLNYIPVKLDSAGIFVQSFLTNTAGDYSFRAGYGSYTIKVDTAGLPFQVTCPPTFSQTTVLSVGNSYDSLADFALVCKPGFDLQSKSIGPSGMIRPGAQRTLYLNAGDAEIFYGTTCTSGLSGTVQAILSGPVNYISQAPGALVPSNINADTITWNVNDFALSNPAADFNILVSVPITANVGDTICIQLNTTPVAGDNDATNNALSTCYPVVNSFDPNEKYMAPSGNVDTSVYWFTYTVFFQNTGTAPAEDIYILDTLSGVLDAESFTFLSASHNVITQLLPGNVLRFNFPDINLADSSTNEPESHGFVKFKIKRWTAPVGTTISNKAYIYFDYNSPILTNITSATLTLPAAISEQTWDNFQIYPNPATDYLVCTSSENFKTAEIKIFNLLGALMKSSVLTTQVTKIDVSDLSNGVYIIEVAGEQNISRRKFIKQHNIR